MSMNRDEIAEVHQQMLEEFIKSSSGLVGMVLIGIRDSEDNTAIEVQCGGRHQDVYRAASSILEAMLRGSVSGGKIEDINEVKLVAKIADILMILGGDEPGSITEVLFERLEPEKMKKN